MKDFVMAVLCVILLFSCTPGKKFDHQYFLMGVNQGKMSNSEIDEASGLAASIVNEGMLWTHNDSGGKARIFLIDDKGRNRAIVRLPTVSNRDWEDIAAGPGPKKGVPYIYIGEIGDNFSKYEYKYIYRIEEPRIPIRSTLVDTTVTQVDSIKFSLPGGPRDTEALLVDPLTRDIYIFSKNEKERIHVYELPYPQSTTTTLIAEEVLSLPISKVTAADISPNGDEILIKNYTNVFYWRKGKNESILEVLQKKPANLPYTTEPQGEAIAFDGQGKGYYTLSEENDHKKPNLMFYRRR
jgi:hypothetical protein